MSELPDDYTPPEDERVFYEHVIYGHKGYLVRREGKTMVERGNGHQLVPYRSVEWRPVKQLRPISKYHVGRIVFEADKALLFAIGRLAESRTEWESSKVTRDIKERWVHGDGPPEDAEPIRFKLANAIRKVFKDAV